MKNRRNHIIVTPHPDDEIIGCFDILNNSKNNVIIVYVDDNINKQRKEETKKVAELFESVKAQIFVNQVPQHLLADDPVIHYPDPIYENHFLHRLQGNIGEQMVRYLNQDIVFYSTNMTAPYTYEIDNPEDKKKYLDEIYPSQKSLWEYDHKYFLFEGHCQWYNRLHFIQEKEETKPKENPNEVESEIIVSSNE
jgi:hypothetical protein